MRDTRLQRALTGLAVGRILLGGASRLAPMSLSESTMGIRPTPELDYMTRIFGARAVALGLGYLTSRGAERRRWQRLAFGVDVSDTLVGISQLRRGEGEAALGVALTALTGAYALVGAAKVLHDLRS